METKDIDNRVTGRKSFVQRFDVSLDVAQTASTITVFLIEEQLIELAVLFYMNGYLIKHENLTGRIRDRPKGIKIMARKNKQTVSKDNGVGEWRGIANVAFGADDKRELPTWLEENPLEGLVDDLVASDYKISLAYNDQQGAYTCALSCYDEASPNYKHTMISRANSAMNALRVAMYKHFNVSGEDWGSDSTDVWS